MRIRFADSRNRIGGFYTALHIVDAIAVHHERTRPVRQTENISDEIVAVLALELDIVNGKHGFDALIFLACAIEHVEEHGSKSRVPIVCVNHVGEEIDERQHFEHRFGEERKTFAVVKVAVKSFALEIILVVHKIVCHTVVRRLVHSAVLTTPTQIHKSGRNESDRIAIRFFDFFFVKRDYHPAIVTLRIECFWKRARNVAESARTNERHCFRCNK